MTITAKIVADSIAPSGVRLTTFVVSYPRFIHSELMTHRDFSRNASSSRAIPIERQIEEILKDPAMPIAFRYNKKGMQAGEVLREQDNLNAVLAWEEAGYAAIEQAKQLANLGVHKQYANRLLEPFAHISVIITATRWSNFFALRYHPAAQPEIAALAELMWKKYQSNQPDVCLAGQWHLPFITTKTMWETDEAGVLTEQYLQTLIKRSVAKCARVSYLNHDGTESTLEQDLALYDRLLGSQPIHASPAEHQAMAMGKASFKSGNFHGWKQFRKMLKGEYVKTFKGPLK